MKGYGNLSFRSVQRPKRANGFWFLWNARLELLFNAPQPYNTKVTFRCIILHYNTLQMRYVTLHYTINFNTKVTIQKKICEPFYGCEKVEKHIKNSAFTAEQLKGMESSKLGVWKRYHLSIEGIRKKGTFLSKMVYTTGLEINARKLAKYEWFW